jgi:hypothetical protein
MYQSNAADDGPNFLVSTYVNPLLSPQAGPRPQWLIERDVLGFQTFTAEPQRVIFRQDPEDRGHQSTLLPYQKKGSVDRGSWPPSFRRTSIPHPAPRHLTKAGEI